MPVYSYLEVVTPPAVEPITLASAKKHLRLDNDDDDDLVSDYLTAARTYVEGVAARALVTQTLRYTVAQRPYIGAYPYVSLPISLIVLPLWYPWPNMLGLPLELPRAPVQSVTSISYGTWGKVDVVLDPSTYDVDPGIGRVNFHGSALPSNYDHISYVFVAGYGADGTAVPANLRQAVRLTMAHFYENRGDQVQTAEMPPAARALVSLDRRITFG